MKTVGECCTAMLLGRTRRWLQVYSDGTSVSNAELVDIVVDILEEVDNDNDGNQLRSVLVSAGEVLSDGKSAHAVSHKVCSTIEGHGDHLVGL